MTKIILSAMVFSVILSGCGQSPEASQSTSSSDKAQGVDVAPDSLSLPQQPQSFASNISVDDFQKLQKTYTLLDVRTAEEYAEGYIDGAPNIDFQKPDFRSKVAALDRNETYVLYCRSGGRSSQAMEVMKGMGFNYLYNLEGGYMAYSAAKQ
jgi:rhodanese-related sulfurtransferase